MTNMEIDGVFIDAAKLAKECEELLNHKHTHPTKDIYGEFYSPVKALSYNKPLVFSIGSRSIGKSTGWAIHLLKEFKSKGRQWIYCRRTKDELQLTAPNYFDNALEIMKGYGIDIQSVEYKGGEYFVDGELAGFAIPLSLQQKYKSSNYSGVWYILYDEFMIAPGSGARYIGGRQASSAEVDAMSSLFQTVDRGVGRAARNECRCVFLGNAGTFFNPFFVAYGIDRKLRPDTKYLAPKDAIYVVELTRETAATAQIKNSIGYAMSTEKTRDYAYENKYADLRDDAFICSKPEGRRMPVCNLVYEGNTYGVFSYPNAGVLYICHDVADGRRDICLTNADHRPNYLLIANWHGHPITNQIKQMYDLGCVKFSDAKCKLVLDFYLKYDII